ncbi:MULTISPECIES: hypothetical protein [Rhodomicrobium]|uniref:hypothetical protein n=1 Tax=Rhodomicrobium TaxID=1068 RepID=UPI000F737408|nr:MULTISPECIES: hypothetical protein [Rhodomicrobium]
MSVRLNPYRSFASSLTILSLLLAQMPPAMAQESPRTGVAIEQCRDLGDPEVRAQIKALTEDALKGELAQVDYAALVDKHWRDVRMSERLDVEIDEAVRVVRADTNMLDRAYSTISRETAERTAILVAERAYGSEGFKSALADLAQGVGADFGARVEQAAAKVSGPVISCVRTALQSRYGGAIATVFARETESNIDAASSKVGGAKIDAGDLILQNTGTISGIVLIVSRRIIAQMVATIGRRVAGLVASRIISTFTGLIGLALIARDIYEASEGVFPLISERMKSDEAKNLIKQEITRSIEADLTQQVGVIAEETTERIYAFWQDFKQKYNVLLSLAEKNPDFAQFLKNRTVDQLGRLGRLVAYLLREDGEAGVLQRTRDGSLSRAMTELNDQGIAMAIETKSLDRALAWAELAGSRLPKAIDYGLPQLIAPDDITPAQLATLLDFDNRAAATRIARLDRAARDALLSLPPATLKELSRRLGERDLAALAAYQEGLEKPAASRVLREVAQDPSLMHTLGKNSIREAIVGSRDQLAAVTMLLRDNSVLSLTNIGGDFGLVRQGEVNYRVFIERYWAGLIVGLLLALLILMVLRRVIFGRPTTIVVRTADSGGKR